MKLMRVTPICIAPLSYTGSIPLWYNHAISVLTSEDFVRVTHQWSSRRMVRKQSGIIPSV